MEISFWDSYFVMIKVGAKTSIKKQVQRHKGMQPDILWKQKSVQQLEDKRCDVDGMTYR